MQMLLSQSEGSSKMSEFFRLAGNELLAPVPNGQLITAQVLLPFLGGRI